MCHHVHIYVALSAKERKDVKKLAGIMIPVYASIMLAVIAAVALTSVPRQGELIASASAPASATAR